MCSNIPVGWRNGTAFTYNTPAKVLPIYITYIFMHVPLQIIEFLLQSRLMEGQIVIWEVLKAKQFCI